MAEQANDRLRSARERCGKTPAEMAAAMGMNLPSYYDLEGCDDLYTSVSLQDIFQMCRLLGISPSYLFTRQETSPDDAIRPADLVVAIQRYCTEHQISVADFENEVGWELQSFLQDPQVGWEWNIDCIRDISKQLGLDWNQVLLGFRVTSHVKPD
jgi:transcriptional regulator with XRE-family HTH domain